MSHDSTSSAFVRVFLVEDNPVFSALLTDVVARWPEAQLVGSAEALKAATEAFAVTPIDLLIADLMLPDGSGADAIRSLLALQPDAQAIVVSAFGERQLIVDAIRAGATGYVLKDDPPDEIGAACRNVVAGLSPMSASVAREIMDVIRDNEGSEAGNGVPPGSTAPMAAPPDEPPGAAADRLTRRELEVLNAISRGYTYKEVARVLDMSVNTVPVHVRRIYRKLRVTNRSEATFEARTMGLLE